MITPPTPSLRYTDEPISKILSNISDGEVIHLDRWKLDVKKNPDAEPSEEGKDTLPLTVLNNYFSFGVDAHIALEFHEARGEAFGTKFISWALKKKLPLISTSSSGHYYIIKHAY